MRTTDASTIDRFTTPLYTVAEAARYLDAPRLDLPVLDSRVPPSKL